MKNILLTIGAEMSKYTTKQVIVVRHDLKNLRKGKWMAQASHASLEAFLDRSSIGDDNVLSAWISNAAVEWLNSGTAKIVVYVENEAELHRVYQQARQAKLPCSIITDAGNTEFNGQPTVTCCAIGPAYSNEIDKITGELPLF